VRGLLCVHSLAEVGFNEDIPETEDTLEGNALQKAQFIAEHFGRDCFADDTGLDVAALGGRPGVYSVRYAGPDCDPEDNMTKLLAEMEGIADRSARFRTVIAMLLNGEEHIFEGEVNGHIIEERRGAQGFAYDTIFQPEGYDRTFAEMSIDEKNEISHRAIASEKLAEFINQYVSR